MSAIGWEYLRPIIAEAQNRIHHSPAQQIAGMDQNGRQMLDFFERWQINVDDPDVLCNGLLFVEIYLGIFVASVMHLGGDPSYLVLADANRFGLIGTLIERIPEHLRRG